MSATPRSTSRRRPLTATRVARLVATVAAATTAITLFGLQPGPASAKAPTSMTTLTVKSTSKDKTIQRMDKSAKRPNGSVPDQVLADTGEQSTKRFSTVGVTWSDQSSGTTPDIQIRTKSTEGEWSDWQTISDVDPIDAGNGKLATDPIYVGDANGVEVRALGDDSTELKDVEAVLIDSPEVASDANPETTMSTTAASDYYPRPPVINRKGWGANESWRCNERKMDTTIKGVVVHHTAGSNSYSRSQSAGIIRDIYAYHTKTLGWCDIGYNFLVDKYGQIFEGRWGGIENPVHGAHATSWNTNTVGVSFMGNYETAKPSATMLEAGAKIIAWKLDAFQRNAIGKVTLAGKSVNIIFGHGDVMATACPGRNIRSQMDALRRNVDAKMGGHSQIYNAWKRRGGESGFLGSPNRAERVVGSGRNAGFRGDRYIELYWHPSYGDHIVYGTILNRYMSMGRDGSRLGWPTSDEKAGPLPGTRMNNFAGGRIIWTSGGTGAWPLWGAFGRLYDDLGDRRDDLGSPSSGEYKSKVISSMMRQNFTKGGMYWQPGSEYAVYGTIYKRYVALGQEGSRLGAPIGNEKAGPLPSTRVSEFSGGRIVWRKDAGAQPLWGAFGRLWDDLGNYRDNLGVPTSGEYASTESKGLVKQNFTGGRMYWRPHVGPYAVYGSIHSEYLRLGAEGSRLGEPRSSEYAVPGGRAVKFEHGTITWNAATKKITVSYS